MVKASKTQIVQIDINEIAPSTIQPRMRFDDEKVLELSQSIAAHGILQPLIVRRGKEKQYEIIAGERRYRASKLLGLKRLPCILMNVMNDKALAIALVENIQREDLNPIEEAMAYARLKEAMHLNQEEVALRVGKDRASVANTIRLLKLPKSVQELVVETEITMGHARALLALDEQEMIVLVAKKIVRENLSVRKTESLIRSIKSGHSLLATKNLQTIDQDLAIERDIQQKLEQILGTKVTLKKENSGYSMVVHFASTQQLNGILAVLGVES